MAAAHGIKSCRYRSRLSINVHVEHELIQIHKKCDVSDVIVLLLLVPEGLG